MVAEARQVLRSRVLAADVGITGANFLIAETGTSIIVTNEGNGDLTQLLPRAHIVLASLEKVVPTLEDAAAILRVLARSATGQEMSVYTTFSTGPKRPDDADGPDEYHVVLLDNGRSALLGSEYQDILRCIRCGACMNHCPVYGAVGGHAYGWVYPGPMGAVLTPSLVGIETARHLPNASTFCGKCESVCPMKIPLPRMMRHYRARGFEARRGRARPARPQARQLLQPAARRRLDRDARDARPAGPHLPADLAGARQGRAMSGDTSGAKAQILAGLRRSLARDRNPLDAAALAQRVAGPKRGLIPARARGLDRRGLVALFETYAKEVSCTVVHAAGKDDVPDAIAEYLKGQNLPAEFVMAPDVLLDSVPWSKRPMLKARRGTPDGSEMVGVARAHAGIAETGTLMVCSGARSPSTINFLPETEVVVLPADAIVGAMEDALAQVRASGTLPRTINFITGPSRTGDIEQRIEMGAHGPRRLHIVIVDDVR
jgi:L-lactate dehydrogenase complex protein LldF